VVYFPETAWNARSASVPCSTCTANPNADLMFDDTFHDGTFNPAAGSNDFPNVPLTASVLFNGTAVYVFCALAESSATPDGDSDMSFYIDGVLRGTFVKIAPGNENVYDYAIPVFAIESLTPEEHNMTLQNGHVNGTKALVLLDEIVYTAINTSTTSSPFPSSLPTSSTSGTSSSSTPSSSNQGSAPSSNALVAKQSHSGVIIGVAVGVVVLLIAALALGWFLRRRKQQIYDSQRATLNPIPPPMTSALTSEPLTLPTTMVTGAGAPMFAQRQNAEAGPSRIYSPSSYTPSSQSQSFGLTSPGLSNVSNSQLDSSIPGAVPYGRAGPSSGLSSATAEKSGLSSSRHRPGPSTSLSTVSAGTSGIQASDTGSGEMSHPTNESSVSLRPAADPFVDDDPDDAPPAYDELRARASMRAGDRKTRVPTVIPTSTVVNQ